MYIVAASESDEGLVYLAGICLLPSSGPELQIVASCPVGFGTSSRILRATPALSVMSRIFAVIYALFGYFWVNLPDFQHFWVDFGHSWTNFEHILTAFISRFWVNELGAQ